MSQEILTKCPNCGLPLTAEHRKGNLMRCPACKTIFEIKLKTSQSLGKCPYGCRETIRIEDYVDDVRIQCVRCHGYSMARTSITNKPWDPTQEESPVLYKYLGKCPKCQEPISCSDIDESGSLVCPQCELDLVARSGYQVNEKIGKCPICGASVGKGDMDDEDKCYCVNCKQLILLDHDTRQIPEGDLFAFPDMTVDELKNKCFEQLFDTAPADIASNMEIEEVKLSYEPVSNANYSKTFIFTKFDQASFSKKFGGKVECPVTIDTSSGRTARNYLPKYEITYKYKGNKSSSFIKLGDREVESVNPPISKRLTGNNWITGHEVSLIRLVTLIACIVWWWTSSHGFFSGLWHLILAAVFFFFIIFLVEGPLSEGITYHMRSRCQNRKVKEFLSYHGLDYNARNNTSNNK